MEYENTDGDLVKLIPESGRLLGIQKWRDGWMNSPSDTKRQICLEYLPRRQDLGLVVGGFGRNVLG